MARIHHATLAKAKKFNIRLETEENDVVAFAKDGTRLASGLQGNKVLEDAITKLTGKVAKGQKNSGEAILAAIKRVKKAAMTPEETACRELGWKKRRGAEGFVCKPEGNVDADEDLQDSGASTWEELYAELVEAGEITVDEPEADDEEEGTVSRSIVKAKYKAAYKPFKAKNGDDIGKQLTDHVSREDSETGEMRIQLSLLRKFAKANDCWVEGYASLVNKFGSWNAGQARMNVGNRLRAKIRKDPDYEIQWV